MSTKHHTLKLLNPKQLDDIYGCPIFNNKDRQYFFSISKEEEQAVKTHHTLKSKCLFLIQLGYFKCKHRFFSPSELVNIQDDIDYIINQYFPYSNKSITSLEVSKPTRLKQQNIIMALFGFKRFSGELTTLVEQELFRLANIYIKSSYVVDHLITFLDRQKIIIPAYSTIQNMVGKTIEYEKTRAEKLINSKLTKENKKQLDALLTKDQKFLHELTLLKRDPKDFKLKEIKTAIKNRDMIKELYPKSNDISKDFNLSLKNIEYYTELVNYYSVYKLSRMAKLTSRMMILCFIFTRYQTINDHLIKVYIYKLRKLENDGKSSAKEEIYLHKLEYRKRLKMAGKLLNLFLDDNSDDELFIKVRNKAFSILSKKELSILTNDLTKKIPSINKLQWNHFDKLSRVIKLNLRPLIMALDLKVKSSEKELSNAFQIFSHGLKKGELLDKDMQTDWLTPSARKYIVPKGVINVNRYEFQMFRTLKNKIESGAVYLNQSKLYRSFEADLIDKDYWKSNKLNILKSLNSLHLLNVDDVLNPIKDELKSLYLVTNQRIAQGENKHIKFSRDKENWTIPYTSSSEKKNHSILDNLPAINLNELMNFVDDESNFIDSFSHVLGKYIKKDRSKSIIMATLSAIGTNTGIRKMARNSNIKFEQMNRVYKNHFRLETLKNACDKIVNKLNSLTIFKHWNIDGENIYSSSDGQKIETSRNTINSRHSPKYFGLGKGIVSYAQVLNNAPVNSELFGANEHESHYVLDILEGNTSDVKPDIHTTDSHGTNRINFALLHLFGYHFAPRYKNFAKEAKKLYSFEPIQNYAHCTLKPIAQINEKLLQMEWGEILRIYASLALKTTTQSTIVRKLSSYARKNNTRKALGELDKAKKSIHILKYTDDNDYRQNIQKSLNRGESFHGLKNAVFYDHQGKFRVSNENEQKIWNESTRLISLCIIYYNSFILSEIWEQREKEGLDNEFLKSVSPIHWRNIDWFGKFTFSQTVSETTVKSIFEAIDKLDFTLFDKLGTKKD